MRVKWKASILMEFNTSYQTNACSADKLLIDCLMLTAQVNPYDHNGDNAYSILRYGILALLKHMHPEFAE